MPPEQDGATTVTQQYFVFSLDSQQYALPLSAVVRTLRAVEITLLPHAPDVVLGIINVHGQVVPVVNMRKRFGLKERDIELSDQFVLAHTKRGAVALVADTVSGVAAYAPAQLVHGEQVLPNLAYVAGVAKLDGKLILIHDLNSFLSLEEEHALTTALNATAEG